MPLVGFVGFPFFALEAWAMYHALCAAGMAIPLGERALARPRRALAAGVIAAVLSVATMRGIDRYTVSSVAPYLEDLPGITPDDLTLLESEGVGSMFQLAAEKPERIGPQLKWSAQRADSMVRFARLATLRGIGSAHALALWRAGIADVCPLGVSDPDRTWRSFQELAREENVRPTPAETRVWQQAALPLCVAQLSH
jgi:hypothetical protein